MSTRIVHLATTHRAADPRIFQKECRTLAEAGYEVVYVVPHDRDEVVEGVQIRAVPRPNNGRERLTATVRAVYERALAEGPDAVCHIHDSDLVLKGFALKRAGRRVVYDAHEDTPKQMRYQHWIPRPVRPLVATTASALERAAGWYFDGIIAAEPENARRFPAHKTALVRNFPLVDELVDADAAPYCERDPVVLYVGSITRVRGLEQMVRAVQGLPEDLGAELVLGGPFHPASLEAEVRGEARLRPLGYLSRPEVASWLGRARVAVVILHPVEKYLEAYPTKLFEYMAAGVPVVASDFPVWRSIVEEAGCGLTVDPLDVEALRGAIEWLLIHPAEAEAMGERGRAAVEARYRWEHEGERLLAFYHRLIGPP
jgi:glycosyltransferase involved in cell wall biosynthesis